MAGSKRKTAKTKRGQLYEVRTSPIHGRGLFATCDIPKETLIGTIEGKPTKRDGSYTIWMDDDEGNSVGLRIMNDLRFVNHARPPNAGFYEDELWSVRRIRAGEEITHDYGQGW